MLHGFGGSHADWNGIVPALAQTARTLAYDLPGHAGSLDFPGAGPAKLAARAILAHMADRGFGRVHIAGHSMGGAIAALMAIAAPERIASLTLLAPGGFGEEINGPLLRRYAAATGASEIRACLARMSGPGHMVSDRSVADRLAVRALPGQSRKLQEIAAHITRDDRQGAIPREALAGLTMPVAVLWGTEDPVLPFRQAEALPPSFQLHEIGNAGHMLIDEAPRPVAASILAMLDPVRRHGGS